MSVKTRREPRLNLAVLRRVSAGVFLCLMIPLILLGFIYRRMNEQILQQYYDRSRTTLRSSLGSLEVIFDNLDQIAVYLGDNSDIVSFYNVSRERAGSNLTAFLKAQQVLSSVGVANDDILNIQLYSAQSRTLLDFSTISLYPERYYGGSFLLENYDREGFEADFLEGEEFLGCSRGIATGTRFHSPESTLIYQIRHIGTSIRGRSNRILFYLSENHLLDLFLTLDSFEDSSLFLLNEKGDVLLRHGEGAIPDSAVSETLQLDSHGDLGGNYNMKLNGEETSVTYCRSAGRGWTCVAALPYRQVLSATSAFRVPMLILFIVAVLAGIMLLILHGVRLAYPAYEVASILRTGTQRSDFPQIADKVRELARSNEQMQETINRQLTAVRAEAFIRLLTGEDLSEEEKLNALEDLGIRKDADLYMILLINANDIRIDSDLEELGMQRALLDNLLKEQKTLEISEIFPVDIERSVLCLTADGISMRDFQRRAEEMITLARKSMNAEEAISYSVGGDIVDSAAKLFKAFLHAQLALKIPQNIFGTHAIQWYERARQFAGLDNVAPGTAEDTVSPQNQVLIENIKKYIRENYSNPQLSLSLVGDEFYITEVYLSKLFKKATGENFSHYVEGIRMNRAKELMAEGCKVTDIVKQVGYNSPQVYRRAWKRYFREEEDPRET